MSEKEKFLNEGYKFDICYYCNIRNCNILKNYIQDNFKDCNNFEMLEFGTCEGSSAFYFMKYFLPDNNSLITIDYKVRGQLQNNLKICNNKNLIFIQDDFYNIMPRILNKGKKFDFIYIDGGKHSKLTIYQIIISWQILRKNGILYLDDYNWGNTKYNRPREAIDFFLNCYKNEYDIILNNSQVAIKKNISGFSLNENKCYLPPNESTKLYSDKIFT